MEEQEKRLRAKLQLQRGEDSELDEDDSEEDDAEDLKKWGRKRSAYYEEGEVCSTKLSSNSIFKS